MALTSLEQLTKKKILMNRQFCLRVRKAKEVTETIRLVLKAKEEAPLPMTTTQGQEDQLLKLILQGFMSAKTSPLMSHSTSLYPWKHGTGTRIHIYTFGLGIRNLEIGSVTLEYFVPQGMLVMDCLSCAARFLLMQTF